MKNPLKFRMIHLFVLIILSCLAVYMTIVKEPDSPPPGAIYKVYSFKMNSPLNITGYNKDTGEVIFPKGMLIVPNYVHFLKLGNGNVSFVNMICILAAFKNQKPERIYFHCNHKLIGKYWERIISHPEIKNIIILKNVTWPKKVYGTNFTVNEHPWEILDATRIRILIEYGGIFLDNDMYLVKNLDPYRYYEMTLGLGDNEYIGSHLLISHREARFLKLWFDTFIEYPKEPWHYYVRQNLIKNLFLLPHKIEEVKPILGVHEIRFKIFFEDWKAWKQQTVIHLLINHKHWEIDENFKVNLIESYKDLGEYKTQRFHVALGEMVQDVVKFERRNVDKIDFK